LSKLNDYDMTMIENKKQRIQRLAVKKHKYAHQCRSPFMLKN